MTWDQKQESRFLDMLYLGVRDGAGFDASLDVLSGLFNVAAAVLLDYDPARPEVSEQAVVGLFSGAALREYQREFSAIDPAPAAFMRRPVGTAIPTYRLLPEEKRRPSVFFNEFFRPLGLEECLGGTLASRQGRFAMIGLQRAPDRRPFDDDDIGRLERLMPHLARALQLRREFLQLERRHGALVETADRLAAGVVALDEHGVGLFANAAARRIASANDGLAIDRHGRLLAANRTANAEFARLEADIRQGGAGGVVRAPRNGGPAYVVTVAPYFLDADVGETRSRQRGAIFVIHDPLLRPKPASDRLALMFGLPNGAAKLVVAIANGEDLSLYAERNGISMNTVRYHLKTAFERTGLRRQTDLARLVTAVLRDTSDFRDRDS